MSSLVPESLAAVPGRDREFPLPQVVRRADCSFGEEAAAGPVPDSEIGPPGSPTAARWGGLGGSDPFPFLRHGVRDLLFPLGAEVPSQQPLEVRPKLELEENRSGPALPGELSLRPVPIEHRTAQAPGGDVPVVPEPALLVAMKLISPAPGEVLGPGKGQGTPSR